MGHDFDFDQREELHRKQQQQAKLAAEEQCGTKLAGVASVDYSDPLESVHRRLMQREHEAVNLHKAAEILHKHPEFADFIWLLRSGLV